MGMCGLPIASKKIYMSVFVRLECTQLAFNVSSEAVTSASEHLKHNKNSSSSSNNNSNNNNSHPQMSIVPKESDEFRVLGLSFAQKESIFLPDNRYNDFMKCT